jgi:hypothetical protein
MSRSLAPAFCSGDEISVNSRAELGCASAGGLSIDSAGEWMNAKPLKLAYRRGRQTWRKLTVANSTLQANALIRIFQVMSAIAKLAPNGLGVRKPTSGPKATYH